MWAYDRQIQLIGIIRCFEAGCQSQSEMAEFWDVTEEFYRKCWNGTASNTVFVPV